MADRIFFTSPEGIRQMIEDLRVIAETSSESIESFSTSMKEQTGFLTDTDLGTAIKQKFPDDAQGSAVFNALQNLEPDTLAEVSETIQLFRKASERNAKHITEEQQNAVLEKLSILICEYPALNRMRKAKRLRVVLGNELERVGFICDARPVFDEKKERIEGMLSVTTMKLVYERQNLDKEEVEITLTERQLEHLIAEAEKARQKLQVMKTSIVEWIPGGYVESEE